MRKAQRVAELGPERGGGRTPEQVGKENCDYHTVCRHRTGNWWSFQKVLNLNQVRPRSSEWGGGKAFQRTVTAWSNHSLEGKEMGWHQPATLRVSRAPLGGPGAGLEREVLALGQDCSPPKTTEAHICHWSGGTDRCSDNPPFSGKPPHH